MRALLLLVCLAFVAAPAGAAAQQLRSDAEIDAATRELASRLRCPVCQGESIQDSPTELAREMKALVRQQLVDGRTPREVEAYFVERYGEWILLQPKAEGFNLVVYLLPLAMLIAGGGFVVATVRRWSRPPSAPDPFAEAAPGAEPKRAAPRR